MTWPGRAADVTSVAHDTSPVDPYALVERLSVLSVRGLTGMYDPRSHSFPHRMRGRAGDIPPVSEGMNVRYTAIATLGLTRLEPATRGQVLAGQDLADVLPGILGLALAGREPGAIALAVWAATEMLAVDPAAVLGEEDRLSRALDRLVANIRTEAPIRTVEHAWSLAALVAASASPEVAELAGVDQLFEATRRAAARLRTAQGRTGLFPHHLPVEGLSRFRSHVACFADQVYPIQALARYAASSGDQQALAAARLCGDHIVRLQGSQGQWWWHYDWRNGTVVERYPVYSFHQYALAPMALLELKEAGGPDHRRAVAAGLTWLVERPESRADLVVDELGVVWRTVGRREPRKLVRKLRSVASARRPGVPLRWLDAFFPAGTVERECRPFELGWMLYAWHGAEALTWAGEFRALDVEPDTSFVPDPRTRESAGERSEAGRLLPTGTTPSIHEHAGGVTL
jgi:hypothetical protein